MSCKKATIFLFILLIILRPTDIRAQEIRPQIHLEGTTHTASGIFILKIMLSPQELQLCGLELDITYDPTKMIICSCERGDALSSLEFDCSLEDGRIRLLFWGEKNSDNGGRIATLCFMPTDSYDGEIEFILSLPTKSSAIYFEDDKILSQNITTQGLRIDSGASELSTDSKIEYPTEMPSATEQEYPSEEPPTEELPTEDVTEKTEFWSEYPSETEPPTSKDGEDFQKTLNALRCISTVASAISILPMLFPHVFRKGYF